MQNCIKSAKIGKKFIFFVELNQNFIKNQIFNISH